jgi:cellulose biosynthesis protein BcsE
MPRLLNRSTLWRVLPPALRGLLGPAPTPPPTLAQALGLDGLPQGLGQLPLGTPVALAWQDRATDLLWAQALLHDLLQHGPVFLLAEHVGTADPLLLQPALAQAHSQGHLRIWLMATAPEQARSPENMAAFLHELEQAGLSPAHALLALASPRAHMGTSVAQVQHWGRHIGRWCRGRSRPVVLAFNGWDAAEQVLGPLRSLATVFEHVALLGSQDRRPLLFVERWNGSAGAVFETRLGLQPDATGQRLTYDGRQLRGSAQRLVEAPDQYRVIATQAAVAGQRGVPPTWSLVPALADVPAAAENASAATVLLHTGPAGQQDDLLHLVYQLRSQHGRTLRIVVYETQDKLRANQEQALLCLGANSVVYREVGFARLQKLLSDLNDTSFARTLPPDYALARASFMPDALRGYLPTPAFCDSVEAMLARTHSMGLQHSFLRLSMQPHVAHLDAVQACHALRDGDVLSADQNALYVFMFACAEADVDAVLARLFRIPPGELFAAQTLYSSVDSMRSALRDLREAARLGVPDYSAHTGSGQREPQHPKAGAGYSGAPGPTAVPGSGHTPSLPLQDAPTADATAPAVPSPTVQARALARRPATQGTPHAA